MTPQPPQKKYVDPFTKKLFESKVGVNLDEFIGDFTKSVKELNACHDLLALCIPVDIHARCHGLNGPPTKSQTIAGEYAGAPAEQSKELGDCLYNMCKFLAYKHGDQLKAATIIKEASNL